MTGLAYAALLLLAVRLMVALVNAFTQTVLPAGAPPEKEPLVSVLIPARNEGHTIGNLLDGLTTQEYSNLEILVYDDLSEDNTASVVRDFAIKDERIQYIRGHALPAHWLGKNHACYQLAQHARGKYMLFIDADVQVSPELLGDALQHMKRYKLDMLSLFPRQHMQSFGEWLTVPSMNWILLSMLPLALTRKSKRPSLAAANGQFMMFTASQYQVNQWHAQVRGSRVEDIVIARTMKQQHYRIQTMAPDKQVACRMYSGFKDAVHGFSKNLPEFFGNSWAAIILFIVLTTGGPFFAAWGLGWNATLVYLVAAALLRALVAAVSRQQILINLLLAPLQHMAFVWMTIQAARLRITRKGSWKGRPI